MPATAGRVRMPANNRVHSSAALQTHGIWQSAIGYDPYAPTKDDSKVASQSKTEAEAEPENPYTNFQGLLALARITGSNTDEARGACKKCGRVGHLTFQCRNFLSVKDDKNEKDLDAIQANVMAELGKLKGSVRKLNGKAGTGSAEESSEMDDESESSDSSADSEMERIVAERLGKKGRSKSKSAKKKKDLSDDEDSDHGKRKKRGRSKKRSGGKRSESDSDVDDARRWRRKDKRRKRDQSSGDEEDGRRNRRKSRKEKRRRRSHRHSEDSDDSEESPGRYKRKSRRARSHSNSDVSDSDDARIGRHSKRSEKKSRKRRHADDE